MGYVRVVLTCYLVGAVLAKSANNNRQERLFRYGYSYTKTIVRPFTITSLVPSSCVHVEPTLPPCRNVRSFGSFPGFGSSKSENETAKSSPEDSTSVSEEEVQTTPLSWGEYLGFSAPTVTVNVTRLTTTTVLNPSVTVTFSVKGCRPLRMPLDLKKCEIEPTSTMLPIVPTSRVDTPSDIENTNRLTNGTARQLQSSQAEVESSQLNVPTTSLDNVSTT